jgi:hypothetical protein
VAAVIASTPALNDVLQEVYAPILAREFPGRTRLWDLHWDTDTRQYVLGLETLGSVTTWIVLGDVRTFAAAPNAVITYVRRELLRLRQTHFLALAYTRGGYC